tara:strand:- start:1626 stop:2852 length:1227 start_codon:yes stop_codon:yes gene_type:complete
VREELLRAMLNSDLIGFLLFEYTRNFLTCCKRMLGLENEFKRGGFLGIEYGGRHVMVQVSTFGVSPDLLKTRMDPDLDEAAYEELNGIERAVAKVEANGGGRRRDAAPVVLAGVDYLDRFKGIQLKLLAWEALLTNYPRFRTGHVFVQILLASRNQVNLVRDADVLREEIATIVKRITQKFPHSVHLEEKMKLSTAARLRIWQQATVVVFSAIREAVNVFPLEYVATRALAQLPAGVAVLSEFSGFSRVLNGALSVNPWNLTQLETALDQALEMQPAERQARARKDLQHITSNTSEDWARRFLLDLKSMRRKQEEHWMAVGFGLASFRMVGMGVDFKALDTQQVDRNALSHPSSPDVTAPSPCHREKSRERVWAHALTPIRIHASRSFKSSRQVEPSSLPCVTPCVTP